MSDAKRECDSNTRKPETVNGKRQPKPSPVMKALQEMSNKLVLSEDSASDHDSEDNIILKEKNKKTDCKGKGETNASVSSKCQHPPSLGNPQGFAPTFSQGPRICTI